MSLATSNIFAALDTKKKKKSSKHTQDASDKKKDQSKPQSQKLPEVQHHLFSGTAKPPVSNWADTDEDDDFEDDIGPLPQSWLPPPTANGTQEKQEDEAGTDSEEEAAQVEEIHEALGLEVTKDDDDDEDDEPHAPNADDAGRDSAHTAEPSHQLNLPPPEKQISKKEQKRLELEEMNRVLAELGIEPTTQEAADAPSSAPNDATEENGTEAAAAAAKKKKKRDKEKKRVEPGEPALATSDAHDSDAEQAAPLNPAEAKKLLAKKKAGLKKAPTSQAASLAAKEAKERAAKKKIKDKKNYNQAPTR